MLFRALLVLSSVSFSCCAEPVVNGTLGVFRGTHEPVQNVTVEAFRGIPYAKPPTGELRFGLPVPFGPVGDFRADSLPAACLQQGSQGEGAASEDCLTLNVYRKNGTSSVDRKAVVIFFHGGNFVYGYATAERFNAAPLAAFGDVITVSMNFRLGFFGFSYLNAEAGNLAFYDQRLAMRWVHENIADFGGDPERVTLLGSSSGATSVSAQITSALNGNETLFRAAIMDGSVANTYTDNPGGVRERIKKMAEKIGCNSVERSELLECFRKAPAEVIDSESSTRWELLYSPIVDNVFIFNDSLEFLAANAKALPDLKIMIGHAKNEGTFVPDHLMDIEGEDEFIESVGWTVRSFLFKIDINERSVQQALLDEYYRNFSEPSEAYTEFAGDGNVCSVNAFAKQISRVRRPVYVYNFERKFREWYFGITSEPKRYGVFHASPFMHFAATPLGGKVENEVVDAEDRKFMLDSVELIANFAKNDRIPVLRGVQWPDFSEEGRVLVLDEVPSVRSGLRNEDRCQKFFDYFSSSRV